MVQLNLTNYIFLRQAKHIVIVQNKKKLLNVNIKLQQTFVTNCSGSLSIYSLGQDRIAWLPE